jgi:hypothetical protein
MLIVDTVPSGTDNGILWKLIGNSWLFTYIINYHRLIHTCWPCFFSCGNDTFPCGNLAIEFQCFLIVCGHWIIDFIIYNVPRWFNNYHQIIQKHTKIF